MDCLGFFGARDMDQIKNVSNKYNYIFTVYNDIDIVLLHNMLYYKHDLIISGYMSQL